MEELLKTSKQISLAERFKLAYERALQANSSVDENTSRVISACDELTFADPRGSIPDRRTKTSLFFSTFKDRRVINRRHCSSINGNWWVLRKYSTDQSSN